MLAALAMAMLTMGRDTRYYDYAYCDDDAHYGHAYYGCDHSGYAHRGCHALCDGYADV